VLETGFGESFDLKRDKLDPKSSLEIEKGNQAVFFMEAKKEQAARS
jgi:hypothetical protein